MDLSIAKTVEENSFEVAAADLYPAAVAEITAALKANKAPAKFLDTEGTPNPMRMYWDDALKIGADAFDLALVPHKDAVAMSDAQKAKRNAALECARKWFTELLHQSIKCQPMNLKITADTEKTFRLS
jgi:hypothetical protein